MSESFFFKSVRKFTEGALWALEKLTLVRSLKAKSHQIPAISQKNFTPECKVFHIPSALPPLRARFLLAQGGRDRAFPKDFGSEEGWEQGRARLKGGGSKARLPLGSA